MDGIKNYWLKEANRHLILAKIGASGKVLELLEEIERCLEKHEEENNERV